MGKGYLKLCKTRKPMETAFFITLLLLGIGEASKVGGNSTCETSGTVFDGEPATVQCRFHRPYEKFVVYRLSTSSANFEEIVVVCTRTENGLNCNNPDGHKVAVPPVGDDQVTISISSARQRNSGTYFCKTLPASEDHADNCTLTVQSNTLRTGNLVTCKANPPVSLGQTSWLSCEFSRNAGSTGIALVKHTDFQGSEENIVVACNQDGQCKSQMAGYLVDKNDTTRVKVTIPQLRAEHTGLYKCKSATLKGIADHCELQTIPAEQKDQLDVNDKASVFTYAALGTLVVVFASIVFSVVFFIVYKRRFKRRFSRSSLRYKRTSTHEREEGNPTPEK